jgi:hypothetical protein
MGFKKTLLLVSSNVIKQDFDLNGPENAGTHLQRVCAILNMKMNVNMYFSKTGNFIVFARHIDSSMCTDGSASVRLSFKPTGYSATDGYVTAVSITFA